MRTEMITLVKENLHRKDIVFDRTKSEAVKSRFRWNCKIRGVFR